MRRQYPGLFYLRKKFIYFGIHLTILSINFVEDRILIHS